MSAGTKQGGAQIKIRARELKLPPVVDSFKAQMEAAGSDRKTLSSSTACLRPSNESNCTSMNEFCFNECTTMSNEQLDAKYLIQPQVRILVVLKLDRNKRHKQHLLCSMQNPPQYRSYLMRNY